MTGEPLDYALAYAALGWPVLPVWPMRDGRCACGDANCQRRGKHPIAPLVRDGVRGATTREPLIRRWFRLYPDAHIGLWLGPPGLVAVDIDPRNGGSIDGLPQPVPATLTADTGGGGLHLIYRLPEGRSVRGKLTDGVDLKHGNGYIIAAPSGHASGGGYRWRDWNPLAGEAPQIAEAPEWLLAPLADAEQGSNAHDSANPQELAGSIDAQTLDDLRDALLTFNADSYDDWVRVGLGLHALGEPGWALWFDWSATSPKFDAEQAAAKWETFASAQTGHRALFAEATARGWENPGPQAVAGADEFEDLGPDESAAERAADGLPLRVVDLSDLATAEPEPPRFKVSGILPENAVTVLASHGGIGKSTLALTIAAHLAIGRDWAGLTCTKSRVAFVSLEDPAAVIRHRLRLICQAHDLPMTEVGQGLTVLDGTEAGPLVVEANDRGTRRLAATAAMRQIEALQGVDVLIVDNASDGFDADENSRRMVRAFLRHLVRLVRGNSGAVLLLVHLPKEAARRGGSESYSGSTAWHNSARSRLALTVVRGGLVQLEQLKSNLGRCIGPKFLERIDGGVLVPAEGPPQVVEELTSVDDAVLQVIADAAEGGQVVPTATAGRTPSARVIHELLRAGGQDSKRFHLRAIADALLRLEAEGRIVRTQVDRPHRKSQEVWAVAPNAPNAEFDAFEPTSTPLRQMRQTHGVGVWGDLAQPFGATAEVEHA